MLMIRLQRVGRKNDPSFRVVVVDSRRGPQSGNFLEILGSYDARKGEPQLKTERVQYWISKGAKTSGTLNNLLLDAKIISGSKIHVSPNPKKETSPEKTTEVAAAGGAEAAKAPEAKEVPEEKSEQKKEDEVTEAKADEKTSAPA